MARVNVEDDLFSDPRFRVLVRIVGDEDKAIGMCVRAWLLAQRYWANGNKLVPKKIWTAAGLAPLHEVDLAEERANGTYCRGTEKHLSWLSDLTETRAKAGKRSAEVRLERYGTAQPLITHILEHTEQTPNTCSGRSAEQPEQAPNKPRTNVNAPAPAPAPVLENIYTPPSDETQTFDSTMAAKWAAWALTVSNTVRPHPEKWAAVFRLLRVRDGFTEAEIEAAFEFVKHDSFWSDKAASVESLRVRGKNGVFKFESILNSMKQSGRLKQAQKPKEVIPVYTEADLAKLL